MDPEAGRFPTPGVMTTFVAPVVLQDITVVCPEQTGFGVKLKESTASSRGSTYICFSVKFF